MRKYSPLHRPLGNAIEILESRQLLSISPQLLADVNTQQSSNPHDFIEFDGRLFFAANGESGIGIWSSDGTAEGTQPIFNVSPDNFVVAGDQLFFSAYQATTGTELWRTDGTPEGTRLVRDIATGSYASLSSFDPMVAIGGTLYFIANDQTHGEALWKTDGTEDGTVMVKDISTSSSGVIESLTAVGDTLFFLGDDGIHGQELWKSDGTAEGTVIVKDIKPGSSRSWVSGLTEFNGALYFSARDSGIADSLWRSDGTTSGTQLVHSIPDTFGLRPSRLTVSGDHLYFTGYMQGGPIRLWVSDGTSAGTHVVSYPAAAPSPTQMMDVDGSLFFAAPQSGSWQVGRVDESGAQLLATLDPVGSRLTIDSMVAFDGELFFIVSDDVAAAQLWRSNGTAMGTYPFRDAILPANGGNVQLAVAADQLFFSSNVNELGTQLWRTDGSYSGTYRVKDILPSGTDSSGAANFMATGSHLFFTADDGHGNQLWASDGTPGNARKLTPSYFGNRSSDVEEMTVVGNLLYFTAVDFQGRRHLGVSDGTPEGTRALGWPLSNNELTFRELTDVNGQLMFLVHDAGLGIFLGQPGSMQIEIVKELGAEWSPPPFFATSNGVLSPSAAVLDGVFYFLAWKSGGTEIWRSDGTNDGTWPLRQVVENLGTGASALTATDDALYFNASVPFLSANGLWKTDGTPDGTLALGLIPQVQDLIPAGRRLYFVRPPYASPDAELWTTDGTIAGTQLLKSLPNYSYGLNPSLRAVSQGEELFFIGESSSIGFLPALWKSDGTAAGTTFLFDIGGSPSFADIDRVGGDVYLNTLGGILRTDGTSAGTSPLTEELRTLRSLDDLVAFRGNLYLPAAATQANYGTEPYVLGGAAASNVVGRRLFYNQSSFDGNRVAIDDGDDAAIAPDKTAYLPGRGIATFAHVSSYSRGINGLMIDVTGTHPGITTDDFLFRVGNNNAPDTWAAAPAPLAVSVRPGAGADGGDRIVITWASGVIKNQWLEVTLLATENTGLRETDVFYFGNKIADSGTSPGAGTFNTNTTDSLQVLATFGIGKPVTDLRDYNRDGRVNTTDWLFVLANMGSIVRLNVSGGPFAPEAIAATVVGTANERETSDPQASNESSVDSFAAAPLAVTSPPFQPELLNPIHRGLAFALAYESQRDSNDASQDEMGSDLDDDLLDLLLGARSRSATLRR